MSRVPASDLRATGRPSGVPGAPEGSSAPLGATSFPAGVNFSIYSRDATGVDLLLFDHADDARPARVIPNDPATQRTYHYWHVFVPGVRPGQIYSQDNETSWFDWTLVEKHADVHRFVTLLNAMRLQRTVEHERRRLSLNELVARAKKAWHGVKHLQPDWGASSHSVAFGLELRQEGLLFHFILNAYWEPLDFELPPESPRWCRWIDTALDSPQDIVPWETAPPVPGSTYRAGAHSVVALIARRPE